MKKSERGSLPELSKSLTKQWRDEHHDESSSERAATMGVVDDLAYGVNGDLTLLNNYLFKLQKQVNDLEQHLVDRDIEELKKLRPAARGAKKPKNDCSDLHPPAPVTRDITAADVGRFMQFYNDAWNKDGTTRIEAHLHAARMLGLRVIVK